MFIVKMLLFFDLLCDIFGFGIGVYDVGYGIVICDGDGV